MDSQTREGEPAQGRDRNQKGRKGHTGEDEIEARGRLRGATQHKRDADRAGTPDDHADIEGAQQRGCKPVLHD